MAQVRFLSVLGWERAQYTSCWLSSNSAEACFRYLEFEEGTRKRREYILLPLCLLEWDRFFNRPYAWWRFADQFHHQASHSKCKCFPEDRNWKEYQHEMWKKRAETTWERGVVVKLISKTSLYIRPIICRARDIEILTILDRPTSSGDREIVCQQRRLGQFSKPIQNVSIKISHIHKKYKSSIIY